MAELKLRERLRHHDGALLQRTERVIGQWVRAGRGVALHKSEQQLEFGARDAGGGGKRHVGSVFAHAAGNYVDSL